MDLLENVGRRSPVRGDTSTLIHVGIQSLNGYENNALYRNLGGGRFADHGYLTGCDRIEDGRGLAAADIDNDGDLDLILNNYLGPALLLVNRGTPGHHWLELRLQGTASNRSAIGARVVIHHGGRSQERQVVATRGYLSGQSLLLHFGLGADTVVDRMEIHWPSGLVETLAAVTADRRLHLVEGRNRPLSPAATGGQ